MANQNGLIMPDPFLSFSPETLFCGIGMIAIFAARGGEAGITLDS